MGWLWPGQHVGIVSQRALPSAAGGTGSFTAPHQQMATEHLWSNLTCLKIAHSHGPCGLVWFLTVPKTEYTNTNIKTYKSHPKLNRSLGNAASVGRGAN